MIVVKSITSIKVSQGIHNLKDVKYDITSLNKYEEKGCAFKMCSYLSYH